MFTIEGLVYFVVYVVVLGLVFWLLNYIVDAIPLAEPFRKVAKVGLVVFSCLILICLLLQFVGVMPPLIRRG